MRPKRDDDDDNDDCGYCVAKPIQSTRITYDGPNLPCSGIHTCDTITIAIQKLDNLLCQLINCCNNQSTSTSTTTTVIPSTSTTSSSTSSTTSTSTSTTSSSSTTTTTTNRELSGLRLLWDDIGNIPVGDPNSISDWNTFFDLPINGNPFTSVVVTGNEINLIGGSGITLKEELFANAPSYTGNDNLLGIEDTTNCVTSVGLYAFFYCTNLIIANLPAITSIIDYAFYHCTSLTTINFPLVTSLGSSCFNSCVSITSARLDSITTLSEFTFSGCNSLTDIYLPIANRIETFAFQDCVALLTANFPLVTYTGDRAFKLCSVITEIRLDLSTHIGFECFGSCPQLTIVYIPSCTDLGGTVEDNSVFDNTIGNVFTLTVPVALMTCNAGAPDGDIQWLMDNNTVTIITV